MTKFVRRLQRIGSTTMVSLPKEWVDARGLAKNSEVSLEAGENSITITIGRQGRPTREIAISYPLPQDENIAANLTGAYLLGYDSIRIGAGSGMPPGEREKIRAAMRRLAGMEIVEEDSAGITMQFLLDAATLSPQRVLKRMGGIVLGMLEDAINAMTNDDRSGLSAMEGRDDEVNRQYFLLVRLIRSTMMSPQLASEFNLQGIDILDYRIAANLIESTGDAAVDLAGAISGTTVPQEQLRRIHDAANDFGQVGSLVLEAFVSNDRKVAIEAIARYQTFEDGVRSLKASAGGGKKTPLDYLDLVYMLERIGRAWADIADLIKPVYRS